MKGTMIKPEISRSELVELIIGEKRQCHKCKKLLVVSDKTIFIPDTIENFFNYEFPDIYNFCKGCYPS